MNPDVPSPELLTGRRALDGISGVQLLTDWKWNSQVQRWVLHVRLTVPVDPKGMIPSSTEWYVLVDQEYPQGPIRFFPSKLKSIQITFPHQIYNGEGDPETPWRSGYLCLDTNLKILGRADFEPYNAHHRLEWHFRRALGWLEDASRGQLAVNGDSFELPHFPGETPSLTIAFSECNETYKTWQTLENTCGIVEFRRALCSPHRLLVKRFLSLGNEELVRTAWGTSIERSEDTGGTIMGIWLRLKTLPVLKPWQAPQSWGELRSACDSSGIDNLLRKCVDHFRNGKQLLLILGFAIPENIGGSPILMHWLTLRTSPVAVGDVPGFRNSKEGHWLWDRTHVFGKAEKLHWQSSENWHSSQISTRGRLHSSITGQRVLVIGAGAVGAATAELFVRSGVRDLTIIDGDSLEIGNLSRHTLGLKQVGEFKSRSVADRLNKASPHASVRGLNEYFPPRAEQDFQFVQGQNVIVDCTGNDHVLYDIEHFPWQSATVFFSISLGLHARRLFFYAQAGHLTFSIFQAAIQPWLKKELDEVQKEGLPREAIGCWHPAFPARADEVWLMSSAAIPMVESYIAQSQNKPTLIVLEKVVKDGLVSYIPQVEEVLNAKP